MPDTPSFKEDFFERVIDVQWKKYGAIFVAGDVCCFNWYIKAKKKGGSLQVQFQSLGPLDFTDKGSTDGAAAGPVGKDKKNHIKGRPTFALGGSKSEGSGEDSVTISMILTSNDGLSWSQSFSETGDDGPDLSGGGFDEKSSTLHIGEMSSKDGHGWSRGGGGGGSDQGGTNEKGDYHSAGEFGFDYLVYAGGIWCGAAGKTMMVALDDDKFAWQTAGSTTQYDVSCLAGCELAAFPKGEQ